MQSKRVGILIILLASVIWSIEPILAKLSYQQGGFLETFAVRVLIACLIAFLYILIRKRSEFRLKKHQVSATVYVAIIGTLVADFLYMFALTQVPVINAVIIGHMQPIFILFMALLLLKTDVPNKYDYIGIILMLISGFLVTSKTIENMANLQFGTIGDLVVLCATVAWASGAVVTRRYLRDLDAAVLTFYRFLPASCIFLLYLGWILFDFSVSIYQVGIGVLIGVGTILYYEGLKRLKAVQVSSLELSTPFFAAVLSFLILGELLSLVQVFGIILLFFGILSLSKKEG